MSSIKQDFGSTIDDNAETSENCTFKVLYDFEQPVVHDMTPIVNTFTGLYQLSFL